jgi:hypothetical protein
MPRWPPLDEDFREALRILAGFEVGYAEALRALIPVAERIDRPRPSYWRVRRFLIDERRRRDRAAEVRNRVLSDLLQGRFPRPPV